MRSVHYLSVPGSRRAAISPNHIFGIPVLYPGEVFREQLTSKKVMQLPQPEQFQFIDAEGRWWFRDKHRNLLRMTGGQV